MNRAFSKLIPASAGSGKTYTLTRMIEHGVLGKAWDADPASKRPALPTALRPEAIVAVTFTEAAAQELRQRVRGALMTPQTMEAAQRLDEAYISTIHAFGLRLLKETAFDRGEVLSPRLLTEDEQRQLLRQAMGRTQNLRPISGDLKRFGYDFNPSSGASAEDAFRADVLQAAMLLSVIPASRSLEELRAEVSEFVGSLYGVPVDATTEELAERLSAAARAVLSAFPESLVDAGFATNQSARRAFQKDYDALRTAADSPDTLTWDWNVWVSLGDLRPSKRGCPTPEGYDELIATVMDLVADVFPRHPGPLADARAHVDALLLGASEVLVAYRDFKDEAGLFDYGDMVGQALKAMQNPALRDRLAEGMDCVVIDEFQDTNPLQFALMWSLIQAELPSVMVGDLKQSIMGFQGADPRLFSALVDQHGGISSPLKNNWRSQPRLMKFINAVSQRLFKDYAPLHPKAEEAALDPLHLLVMPDKPNTKTDKWRAARVAEQIRNKLNDPSLVVQDRHTKQQRPLRGGDCAVLCPTHSMLKTYANALKAQGLKVRLKSDGWIESYEVQMALEALALLHDPANRHARLYLAVSALGEHTLEDAVPCLLAGEELRNPAIDAAVRLAETASRYNVDELLPMALEALGLYALVSNWPDSRQARANLLQLEGMAKEFVDAQPESRMAAGIYGTGVPQFLCWLHLLADRENAMPPASTIDENAVELVTWHASKGREWPIVAVCGWAQKVEPRLPELGLTYADFSDLDNILEGAGLAWAPSMVCKEANDRIKQSLAAEHEQKVLREIYVALTRPREQLLLEWPLNAVDPEASTRAGFLQKHIGLELGENEITLSGRETFAAVVQHAEGPKEEGLVELADEPLPEFGRRAIRHAPAWESFTPDARSPSQHGECAPAELPVYRVLQYGPGLNLPEHSEATEVGSFVHKAFELPLGCEQSRQYLCALAKALWPNQAEEVVAAVLAQVAAFTRCLRDELGFAAWDCEVPIFGLDAQGVVVNGVIDLLAVDGSRKLVIDHKSDRDIEPARMLERHLAQMQDYQALLGGASLGIHAVRSGQIILVDGGGE